MAFGHKMITLCRQWRPVRSGGEIGDNLQFSYCARCPLHVVPNLTSQDTSNIVNEMAGGARIQYAFIIKDKDNVHIIHHAYQENLINIYFMLVCFFSLYLLII